MGQIGDLADAKSRALGGSRTTRCTRICLDSAAYKRRAFEN